METESPREKNIGCRILIVGILAKAEFLDLDFRLMTQDLHSNSDTEDLDRDSDFLRFEDANGMTMILSSVLTENTHLFRGILQNIMNEYFSNVFSYFNHALFFLHFFR